MNILISIECIIVTYCTRSVYDYVYKVNGDNKRIFLYPPFVHNECVFSCILEGARASTGQCVDVSSEVII